MRIADLADALGLPESTVRGWARRGRLETVKIEGCVVVPAREAERLLAKVGSQPSPTVRPLDVRRAAARLLSRLEGA